MEWIEKSVDDVCLLPKPKDVVFPEDRTNEEMHLLCKKLRGHMSVTDSQAKQDALVREYKRAIPGTFTDISRQNSPMKTGNSHNFISFQLNSGQVGMTTQMKVILQTITLARF